MNSRSNRALGRTLFAGWLYAAAVVVFAQDIAGLSLHLGARWLDNPPVDPSEYPLGFGAFVAVSLLALYYVRSAAPTVEWDIMHERFSKPMPTRWVAFAGFAASVLVGTFDPVEPLVVATGALLAVKAALDALLLRDLRLAVPHVKRPSVLLRAPMVAAACCVAAALVGKQPAMFLLRTVLVVLVPVAEPLGFEVGELEDLSTAKYWDEDDPNPRRISAVCVALLAFVLATFLLAPVDAGVLVPFVAMIGLIYLLSSDFTDALRLRAVFALLLCAGAAYAADDASVTVSISCTMGVLVLMSLAPAHATARRLLVFLVALALACWVLGPWYRDPVIEVFGAAWFIFAFVRHRFALWTRTGARHIRFYLD